MIEPIDFKKSTVVPVYEQLARTLKENIIGGVLRNGTKLPPEPELAQQFGVSRPTLRKCLKRLEEQNLINQRRGCGTFVSYEKTAPKRIALIGLSMQENYNSYMSNILYGLNLALQASGFEILFMDYSAENSLLNKFHGSGCDGIICSSDADAVLNELSRPHFRNVPIVFLNNRKAAIRVGNHACVAANSKALEIAVEYIAGLGHRRVAYIAASSLFSDLKLRNDEFLAVRGKYGLEEDSSLYLTYPDPVAPWYDQARFLVKELCLRKERPSAIICPNASNAYGAWQGIMDAGLRIPEDISLIGFDCESSFNPHLSTIRQPLIKMAETAGQLLTNMLNQNKIIQKELIFDISLEERGSCVFFSSEKTE